MVSKLPKKTLHVTDIICTKTILYRQEANQVAIFYLILNKASKDAILTKNDDAIGVKF